jgi:hypothetical protein
MTAKVLDMAGLTTLAAHKETSVRSNVQINERQLLPRCMKC